MIEQLMNPELQYGEPEYSKIGTQICEVQDLLAERLDADTQRLLEQLSDLYIRQGNVMLKDVFAEGFCTAVEFMLDFLRHKH